MKLGFFFDYLSWPLIWVSLWQEICSAQKWGFLAVESTAACNSEMYITFADKNAELPNLKSQSYLILLWVLAGWLERWSEGERWAAPWQITSQTQSNTESDNHSHSPRANLESPVNNVLDFGQRVPETARFTPAVIMLHLYFSGFKLGSSLNLMNKW